ncbi:MAG: hypothetical protein KDC85_04275 [Saprospiraceae bacterium]|nr:hypothetical protein [Saprospiraceae bacterium]MCB9324099.1 hypothetical protein [Lewinellaceae bacterium]
MKKTILLFTILLVSVSVWGQMEDLPATISWGEELKEPANTYIDKIVNSNSSGMITVRHKTGLLENTPKIYVEQYDEKMNLKRSEKIALEFDGNNLQFEDLIYLNGQLYLLTSYNNKAKETSFLFYQTLSSRFTPSNKINKIAEINTGSWLKEGSYDIQLSKDSSKVLVYGQLPYKRKDAERFTLNVFDNSFNPLWNREITLPYPDELLSLEAYQIDNEGNVYLLGKLYYDRLRTTRNGKPNYHYIVLAYTNESQEASEYKIDLQDKFITDLTFKIGNDGNLVCAGFYSEKLSYSMKGTCFFGINAKTKETFNIHLKPFDFEFLTEYMSDGAKQRAKKAEESGNSRRAPELYRYSLDDLILRSDGGAVLIAEQYYIETRTYYDRSGISHSIYYYNYNDIIVVNIRPDGSIEWATHIPKRQQTRDDGGYYSSYAKAVVRDKIYFVFNDNIRNFSEKENRRTRKRIYYFDGRNSVVALAEISKDGELNTWPLFSNRDANIITRPKICHQTGSRKMVIYGERGKRYRFANLFFEK